ncbi:MAG: GNAT family N-acetyltransferase [Candidatus Undinarchaeales archaeon]|jgi:predicted N-acetyltransferase YhbS|nr:GNAT family N-acetyltransferase [Candidatus Undinarchaeales archaeon]
MKIERFQKGDEDKVVNVILTGFRNHVFQDFTKEGRELIEKDITVSEVLKNKDPLYVAKINNTIVGVGSAFKKHNRVGAMFVNKKYHGQGIGSALLKKVESYYKGCGVKKIFVWSALSAVGFYTKHGFKKSRGISRKQGMVYQPMKKEF